MRQVTRARRMMLIGSIWYIVGALFFLFVGTVSPIDITINGVHTQAYVWEFATYPGPLVVWVGIIILSFICGFAGLTVRNRVKSNPTTLQGVFLLVFGILTFITGAGVLYIIAGIQVLLACSNNEHIATQTIRKQN